VTKAVDGDEDIDDAATRMGAFPLSSAINYAGHAGLTLLWAAVRARVSDRIDVLEWENCRSRARIRARVRGKTPWRRVSDNEIEWFVAEMEKRVAGLDVDGAGGGEGDFVADAFRVQCSV
jgi:hypothetical protein